MKALVLVTIFIISATVTDIALVRQKYIAAVKSATAADELYAMLDDVPDNSKETTMVAYKAAALTLQAKHAKGMITKKKLFERGAKLLEAVIAKDADNYEARLIRLSIQEDAPKITGYKKDIVTDKAFLIKNYGGQTAALKKFTKEFVAVSTSFTKDEKAGF
ncbi:MAG: hypothetical protein ACO1N9_13125 [Flavobacterium sp.]